MWPALQSTGHQAINYILYHLSVQKTGVQVLHWGDNPVNLTFLISPVPICESSVFLSTSGQLSNKVSGLVYSPNCCNQITPSKPVNEGRVYFCTLHCGREDIVARAGSWLVTLHLQSGSTAWTGSRARLENLNAFSSDPLPLERSTSECSTTFPKSATIWGQSIQTHELVRDISQANHKSESWGSCSEKGILMGLDILLQAQRSGFDSDHGGLQIWLIWTILSRRPNKGFSNYG